MKQRFIALLLARLHRLHHAGPPASASSANSAVHAMMLGGLTSEQAAGPDAALTRGQLAKLLAATSRSMKRKPSSYHWTPVRISQ